MSGQKDLVPKEFKVQKKFHVQNNFGFKQIWVQTNFSFKQIFEPTNNSISKRKLRSKNCFGPNKKFGSQKNGGQDSIHIYLLYPISIYSWNNWNTSSVNDYSTTAWLHLTSWNLPDSKLSRESKMEPSVAIYFMQVLDLNSRYWTSMRTFWKEHRKYYSGTSKEKPSVTGSVKIV